MVVVFEYQFIKTIIQFFSCLMHKLILARME
jgi:hypothetical protein